MRNVEYVPEASDCLLSVSTLQERSELKVDSAAKVCTFVRNGEVILRGRTVNRMWEVIHPSRGDKTLIASIQKTGKETEQAKDGEALQSVNKAAKVKRQTRQDVELKHARLGHPGKHMKLQSVMDGLDDHGFCPPFCRSCVKSKISREVSREPMSAATKVLEGVHMDLYGPVPTTSLQKKRYMLTITDQKSGRVWVYFRVDKNHIPQKIKE